MDTLTRPRAFLPSDLNSDRSLIRAITAQALAVSRGVHRGSPGDIAKRSWPRDTACLQIIERAASTPATTFTSGWADSLGGNAVAEFVSGLQPISAAARLFAAAVPIDLTGRSTVSVPRASTNTEPTFVQEGAPIPVVQDVIEAATLGPPTKLALIKVATNELAEYSAPAAEKVISLLVREAGAIALDRALLSDDAGASYRPPGLLYGIAPLSSTTGSDLFTDLQALVQAVVDGGGGGQVWFVCHPSTALGLKVRAGAAFDYPIISSIALDPGVVVAIDPGALAYAFGTEPEILVSREGTIVMADDPGQLVSSGTPAAGTTRSLFQTNSLAIRCVIRTAWSLRAPAVAWVEDIDL